MGRRRDEDLQQERLRRLSHSRFSDDDDWPTRDDPLHDEPTPEPVAQPAEARWRRWQTLLSSRVGLSTPHLAVLTVGAVLAVVATAWYVWGTGAGPSQALDVAPPAPVSRPTPPEPSATPTVELYVHVIGAVKKPGVVTLPQGARVADAIHAAGGLSPQARPGELNLAQVVADGQQIWIGDHRRPGGEVRSPMANGTAPSPGPDGGPTTSTGASAGKVNINRATVAELDTLPGVGPVTAQRIVDHRENHGPFSSVDQLGEVSGIGERTLQRLRDLVTV